MEGNVFSGGFKASENFKLKKALLSVWQLREFLIKTEAFICILLLSCLISFSDDDDDDVFSL